MATKTPPLVDLKVSNPVTYIKQWWNKIMGSEGVDFRFRIHPLTAIAIAVVIASIGFGVGRISLPFDIPFLKFQDITLIPSPTPSPVDWKDTAFTGTLQYSPTTSKYFLTTTSASEAIGLQVPNTINLQDLVGKRILVIGSYNKQTRTMVVSDARDMEILPKSPIPLPTNTPTPSPIPTPEPTSIPIPIETSSPNPQP